jgi:hypothetical protein
LIEPISCKNADNPETIDQKDRRDLCGCDGSLELAKVSGKISETVDSSLETLLRLSVPGESQA